MRVFVVNETTVLDEATAWNYAWVLDYASRRFFAPAWGIALSVSYMPKGAAPPARSVVLQLLDTSDQAGALGYHDEDGSELPLGKVFVGTAQADGQDGCAVAAHELWEMAVDPHVNLSALTGDGKRLYAYEVGDPAQGGDFDAFDGTGKTAGLKVCDFALPSYFDPNTAAQAKTSLRGRVKGPFGLAPGGYVSYVDTANFAAGWTQQFGDKYTGPPPVDRDDRVGLRANGRSHVHRSDNGPAPGGVGPVGPGEEFPEVGGDEGRSA